VNAGIYNKMHLDSNPPILYKFGTYTITGKETKKPTSDGRCKIIGRDLELFRISLEKIPAHLLKKWPLSVPIMELVRVAVFLTDKFLLIRYDVGNEQ
jgi:hypothetical protein